MKWLLLAVFSAFIANADASVSMTRVDPRIFIHDPQTDFDAISTTNEALKMKMVEYLFEQDMLDHLGTKAYDSNADFTKYYKQFGPLYRLVDLNRDAIPELLFNGYVAADDDKEYLEIYISEKGTVQRVFREVGHLLAYKIHPNTREVLLFHHQYPCCENASHNLNRLRLVGTKIVELKRYFLGRDHGMVGPFFPKKSVFTGVNKRFKEKTVVYWSPAVVTANAWPGRTAENKVATYDSASVYVVLAREKKWQFVLVKNAPLMERSRVINPANFTNMWIYGWIRED